MEGELSRFRDGMPTAEEFASVNISVLGPVLKEETVGELCYYHEHKSEIESLRSELASSTYEVEKLRGKLARYRPEITKNKEPRKKRWYMGGHITGGDCSLFVEADTIEEAIKLFHNDDWETENGSWECEPDVDTDDLEAIEHELSRQNKDPRPEEVKR
jgi:hypothetical protein